MSFRFEYAPDPAVWREGVTLAGWVAQGRLARPRRPGIMALQALTIMLAGLGAATVGWLIATGLGAGSTAAIFAGDLGILVFFGLLFGLSRRHAAWQKRRFFERLRGNAVAEVGPDGIAFERDGYVARLPWHLFDAVHQGLRGVLVMAAGVPITLPNGLFDDAAARAAFIGAVEGWAGGAAR